VNNFQIVAYLFTKFMHSIFSQECSSDVGVLADYFIKFYVT